ncbi:MAG TPA: prepilin peptidase [Caulifigura sp.]|nr:prepilin peptidase [Caulifigura sp.]
MGDAIVSLWDSTHPLVLAAALGTLSCIAAFFLTARSLQICDTPSTRSAVLWAVACGLCAALFAHAAMTHGALFIPEVRPSPLWERLRIVFQCGLIVLLTAITATDWRTCFIPLFVPIAGLVTAPILAFLAGDLQIAHVWVDWNAEIPQLAGPYLPGWLSTHPHLHGLAWSLAGALVGTALAWVVRRVSSWALGMPAFGEGDVWLMAMIGAFLGWQPAVLAFAIAPIAAIAIGLPTKSLTGRPYIPYGPFLAFGAVVVLFSWRWLWMFEIGLGAMVNQGDRRTRFRLRDVFGDPWMMAGVAGVMTVALAVMLVWKRWAMGGASSSEAIPQDASESVSSLPMSPASTSESAHTEPPPAG